jgi:hypothetical protein
MMCSGSGAGEHWPYRRPVAGTGLRLSPIDGSMGRLQEWQRGRRNSIGLVGWQYKEVIDCLHAKTVSNGRGHQGLPEAPEISPEISAEANSGDK